VQKNKSLSEMLAEGFEKEQAQRKKEDMHWSDRYKGLIILLSILAMVGGFAFLMIMGETLK
jgi:hypothetical protein